MKAQRHAAILRLVREHSIPSQERLRALLVHAGFDVTQATLSRDIRDLGLVKRAGDGAYQRAGAGPAARTSGEQALRRAVAEYLRRVDHVQLLLVLRTDPGQAQPLAVAIDRADQPEVVGTIAGDDTILVIGRSARQAAALARRLEHWARQ